jgi:hypothetical protein
MRVAAMTVILIALLAAHTVAQEYTFELNAGEDLVQGRFDYRRVMTRADLVLGLGGFYHRDAPNKFNAFEALIGVGSGSMWPAMLFDVGFKGIFGTVEDEYGDGDLAGTGFYVAGRLFLDEWVPYIPPSLFFDVSYIPGALAMQDTNAFLQVRGGIALRLMESAAIQVGCQYDWADFAADDEERTVDDAALFFGLRLSF